ncbi:glutamyl-tRNA amidotransferase [Nibricoccus aquaticus]|uniref:Glutamyl-tRNA amidotransferase n=2 Tax=Nibricoccus aquaticus TaxID=2576891 RepID=A0A290QI14_9BACT|nr:glutamyl-tRNA amidotransferase [Nibricoccus aquaticus]
MMATIYETLRADIVVAMKARDAVTTTALRTADAAIKRAEMDTNKPIDDALVLTTLRKAVKNLADANVEFAKGGRADLIAANENEIRILEKYLPKNLDAATVEVLVDAAIKETGAASKKEMGKVIGALKKHPDAALIDFGAVSKIVQAKLP